MTALERTQHQLDALTQEIHALYQEARRVLDHLNATIIEIGRRLLLARDLLAHGDWLPWLEQNFRWSDQTARNYMHVAKGVGDRDLTGLAIEPGALYVLTAPSAPEAALATALEQAQQGTTITQTHARALVRQAREPKFKPVLNLREPPTIHDDVPMDDDEEAIWRTPVAPPPPSPTLHFFDDVPMDDFDPTPSPTIAGNPSAQADVIRPPSRWVLVELEPGLPATEGEALAAQLRLRRGVVRWAEAFPSSGPLIDALEDREEAP